MQYRSMQMLKVPHVDAKLHPSNSKTIPFLIAVAEKTVDRFRWCRLCMFVQLFIAFWKKHKKYTYLRDGYGLRNVAHHMTCTCACLVYGENECMCCMFCPMSTFFITLEKCNSDWWCAQRRTFLFLCFFLESNIYLVKFRCFGPSETKDWRLWAGFPQSKCIFRPRCAKLRT